MPSTPEATAPASPTSALQFATTDDGPHLQTGSIFVPADYDRLTVRMQLPDGLTTTGDFVDVVIDLAENAVWNGTIRSLRLSPFG